MKTELIGSAGTGVMAAAAGLLAQYGITPVGVLMAALGAGISAAEVEGRRWPVIVAVAMFNAVIGALAGPVIVVAAELQFGVGHPALLLGASFLAGYIAHDALGTLRDIVAARADRWGRRK